MSRTTSGVEITSYITGGKREGNNFLKAERKGTKNFCILAFKTFNLVLWRNHSEFVKIVQNVFKYTISVQQRAHLNSKLNRDS